MNFAAPLATPAVERLRIKLRGAVQGVGMRPFVHRLAAEAGFSGFVRNGADGVTIEVEGAGAGDFVHRLSAEAPALARIDGIAVEHIFPSGERGFSIRDSADNEGGARAKITARIVPDAATCDDCLSEIFDPGGRFFGYPFVNCTQCGPRLTIARRLPYDRATTSMAGFPMCAACAADYADPANRRFHAEPIACPDCGPRLKLVHGGDRSSASSSAQADGLLSSSAKDDNTFAEDNNKASDRRSSARLFVSQPIDAIDAIAAAVLAGKIVALKGIGGFHLMCDARNETAVAALRQRKGRDKKPFGVMVADAAALRAVARPTVAEIALAKSPARPIVLMDGIFGALAPSVSPGLVRLGAMLAYAPVHHLLFAALAAATGEKAPALVATSANPGGEPLVVDDADAARRLGGIADLVVTHDRPIVTRADDSVAQIVRGAPALLRRARGFVPEPIELAEDGPPTLALGAHLKSTITVTRGSEAFVSQHIGDLDDAETVRFWRETADHLLSILDVRPDRVACDLHPDCRSSQLAETFGFPVFRVQHHAAHVAAVAAEHRLTGPVFGLALDGHGYGDDGGAWGGEAIVVDGFGSRRIGHLAPLPLPGGDRAAREPWRMGVAALHALGRGAEAEQRFPDQNLAGPLAARMASGAETRATSSLGRLFDAAAALLGVRLVQAYEGQAAMELEAFFEMPRVLDGGWSFSGGVLSFAPLLAALADERDARAGSDLFHGTLIAGLTEWAARGAAAENTKKICLGGGCMMNRALAEGLFDALSARGLKPLLASKIPPNDGGVSLGQAVMARRANLNRN